MDRLTTRSQPFAATVAVAAASSNRRLMFSIHKIILIVNSTILLVYLSRQAALATSIRSPLARLVETNKVGGQQSQIEGRSSSSGGQSTVAATDPASPESPSAGGAEPELKLANNVETNALIYLQKYGYMTAHSNPEANNNLISEESFSSAITSFQRFAGIPETGAVDELTLRYMQLPRCGNLDTKPPSGSRQPLGATRMSRLRASLRRRRKKRYALQGSKWRRQELTYRISQYPTRFNGKRHEVEAQIEKAFGIWSQVAPIDFVVKKEGRVHIDIRFASGDHGDGDAFDGPGNTLAHAYFPQYGGDAHFDDQEYWTIDSYAGTNIFQVAAHELGHSLGLGHSNVREALMAPFYQKYKPNFRLHADDVLAIQALYGEKPFLLEVPQSSGASAPAPTTTTSTSTTTSTTTTTTTTTTTPLPVAGEKPQAPSVAGQATGGARFASNPARSDKPGGRHRPPFFVGAGGAAKPKPSGADRETNNEDEAGVVHELPPLGDNGLGGGEDGSANQHLPDLCTDATIDAVTRTEDGSSYVFKGDHYWLMTSEGLAKGYPRRIGADWDGLPGSLDAALTWADGKTFFFKGNKYWRFKNKRRDVGYPKLISAGFAGIPDDIDAAFVWSGNGRTYIFKGAEYWRFDSKADPPVSSEYPRSIKVWNGVPAHINAAFRWENNVTYFFKGPQYYRFNDKEFKVEPKGRPPFPRLSSEWWFGCVATNLAQRAASVSSSLKDEASSGASGRDTDWSFFAGLEGNTRLMGTHISDHRPADAGSFGINYNETGTPITIVSNKTSGQDQHARPQLLAGRHNTAKVSSSAISIAQFNNLLILFASLLLTSLSWSWSSNTNVGR